MKHLTTLLLCGWILWGSTTVHHEDYDHPKCTYGKNGASCEPYRYGRVEWVALDAFETKLQCEIFAGLRTKINGVEKLTTSETKRCWPAGHKP